MTGMHMNAADTALMMSAAEWLMTNRCYSKLTTALLCYAAACPCTTIIMACIVHVCSWQLPSLPTAGPNVRLAVSYHCNHELPLH